jgi:eukaryotic-like serine/threonine-protein kinase
LPSTEKHIEIAMKLFERMQDPWGIVEMKLLSIQLQLVALASKPDSKNEAASKLIAIGKLVAECEAIELDEAEPRQHRHLTKAWYLHAKGDVSAASEEVAAARLVFRALDEQSPAERAGDHTPQLLDRLTRLTWPEDQLGPIHAWRTNLLAQDRGEQLPPSSQWPSSPSSN